MKNLFKISFSFALALVLSFFAANRANADTLALDPISVSGAGCHSLGMQITAGVCTSPYPAIQMRSFHSTWNNFTGWTRADVYQYTKGVKLGDEIWSTVQIAEMLADTEGNEYLAAVNDIETWRIHGVHDPVPGWEISWLSVNWDDHGAQNATLSNHEVLWNFVSWALTH